MTQRERFLVDQGTAYRADPHGGATDSGMAVPPTVLVTAMDNGVLILQGRSDGPRVSLTAGEALALQRELATAFGSAGRRLGDGQGDIR